MPRGRPKISISEEDIRTAIKNNKLLKDAAKQLGVSYPTFLQWKQFYGLDTQTIAVSEVIPELEYQELTEDEFEDYMYSLEEKRKPSSYETFRFKFDESIIIRPFFDPHLGSDSSLYKEFWEDVRLVKHTSNVKCVFGGDYIDNFTKHSPGSAVYTQVIPPPEQKIRMEWITKYLGRDKILGVIQGCHDEWSHNRDQTDFGKYLANLIGVPYLGFAGILELEVGDNLYRGLIQHKDRYFNKANLCHGLKRAWREEEEFDFGISGHRHRFNMEVFTEKGRTIKVMKCSGYKGRDRFLKKEKKERHLFRREAIVLLADEVESVDQGILMFENIDHALRFL